LLGEVHDQCTLTKEVLTPDGMNPVTSLYNHFTDKEISDEIALIITPIGIKPEIEVIFQNVDDLHLACPNNTGDWYFTGNYPTIGGHRVCNQSFVNFMKKNNVRAYT